MRAFDSINAAPANRPFVVAQLGQSLDGRIATLTGESRWINGDAALDHVHRLRAHVDAVVVGAGTAVLDDPQLTVRRTAGRNPARVVIDPNGRLSSDAKCLVDDGVRRVVVRRQGNRSTNGAEVLDVSNESAQLCPRALVAKLYDLGLKKLLIEGGARTISAFVDADAVDRLHVLVAPVILGSGKASLELNPIQSLVEARRPQTSVYLLDGGEVLFDCDLRRRFDGKS
ncbi:MAG: RibD family protein [Hyphomicrobiaceae bacterium]